MTDAQSRERFIQWGTEQRNMSPEWAARYWDLNAEIALAWQAALAHPTPQRDEQATSELLEALRCLRTPGAYRTEVINPKTQPTDLVTIRITKAQLQEILKWLK